MRRNGFTVLEVIITIAILGFIIGITSSSFHSLAPKYRLKKAVWEVHTRLNYARYKAIFDGSKVRVTFGSAGCTIEKYDENKKEWKKESADFLEGVKVQANNSPVFHPGGNVSNLASIYIFNSWGKYKITLAISGRIKIIKL